MANTEQIDEAISELVRELLEDFDSRVPETGVFPDHRVAANFPFVEGGPLGRLELAVMSMDPARDPSFAPLRFVSIRVKKSPKGGVASVSCFHGTRDQLRARLLEEAASPVYFTDRVSELADGLPEETDPELWR